MKKMSYYPIPFSKTAPRPPVLLADDELSCALCHCMRQTTGIFSKPVNGRRPCLRGVQLLRRQGGFAFSPTATPPTNARPFQPSFPVIGSSQHQPALIHHTPHTTHRSTRQARAGASARLRRRRRRRRRRSPLHYLLLLLSDQSASSPGHLIIHHGTSLCIMSCLASPQSSSCIYRIPHD